MTSTKASFALLAGVLGAALLYPPDPSDAAEGQGDAQAGASKDAMPRASSKVSGRFDVKLAPLPAEPGADPSLGRMSIDKEFHGELQGVSKGQMLTGMTAVKGSAGYVAIERFTGSLAGRAGAFTLQHTGVMDRGAPSLTITVIPDSGAEQLAGVTGSMTIDVQPNGDHFYTFTYTLPPLPE